MYVCLYVCNVCMYVRIPCRLKFTSMWWVIANHMLNIYTVCTLRKQSIYVCMHVSIVYTIYYICMYVCMYVCMYACMVSGGTNLRRLLVGNGINVYRSITRWTNCSGKQRCGTCIVDVSTPNLKCMYVCMYVMYVCNSDRLP